MRVKNKHVNEGGVFMNFENKLTHTGIRYSRYIASWTNAHKARLGSSTPTYFGTPFQNWLRSEGLDEDEIAEIIILACTGKLELETSARKFLDDCKL